MSFSRNFIFPLALAAATLAGCSPRTTKPVPTPASVPAPEPKPIVMDSVSYSLGLLMAQNLGKQGFDKIDGQSLGMAVEDVVSGNTPKISLTKAQQILEAYTSNRAAEQNEGVKEASEKFLEENAGKPGVKTTASGLQYMVLQEGSGKQPTASNEVVVHYEGTTIDGKVFDSSYKRGETISFPLGNVIPGWTEGLQLMKEGAKYRFFIPQNLAYGARGAGDDIPPFSTLIFDVELFEVK